MRVTVSFSEAAQSLSSTFGVIFKSEGIPSLFTDAGRVPIVLVTIMAFSLTDIFDTIGTFLGTGLKFGIFCSGEKIPMDCDVCFDSRMDRALISDAVAISVGALFGTSNTTTFVESASGIAMGGRTGLTSVFVAILFILSAFFSRIVSAIPFAATGPALVIVGVIMLSSFSAIKWDDLAEAIPAFFAGVFTALCYSVSYGIAAALIFYCVVKLVRKEHKGIHAVLWVSAILFVMHFIFQAVVV